MAATRVGLDSEPVVIMDGPNDRILPMVFGSYRDMAAYFDWCDRQSQGRVLDMDGTRFRQALEVRTREGRDG